MNWKILDKRFWLQSQRDSGLEAACILIMWTTHAYLQYMHSRHYLPLRGTKIQHGVVNTCILRESSDDPIQLSQCSLDQSSDTSQPFLNLNAGRRSVGDFFVRAWDLDELRCPARYRGTDHDGATNCSSCWVVFAGQIFP